MSEQVLFVDDEPKVLNGIRRQFEDVLEFATADSPEEMLCTVDHETIAVVVSDMRMPGMNGIELLSRIKERSPDTVRIMMTGYADLQATIQAVNEGSIFRFLSKPCSPDVLEKGVRDGLAQYRLVTAEHELLEGTLHGSIKVLSELLSLVNPLAFGRTSRVRRIAVAIAEELQIDNLWDLKIAAMLFPLGCMTVSEAALECALSGRAVPVTEQAAFAQHGAVARKLLEQIPRLDGVAAIVAYQDKCFDGSGCPKDAVSGDDIPIGARILKVASDFEIVYERLRNSSLAAGELAENAMLYDRRVLQALRSALQNGLLCSSQRAVSIQDLEEGMVLASDVRSTTGQLMVTAGQEITDCIQRRLRTLFDDNIVNGQFQVEVLADSDLLEPVTP